MYDPAFALVQISSLDICSIHIAVGSSILPLESSLILHTRGCPFVHDVHELRHKNYASVERNKQKTKSRNIAIKFLSLSRLFLAKP